MTKKVHVTAQELPAQATQGKANSRKGKQHKQQQQKKQQQEEQQEQQGQQQPHGHPYGVQPWGNFYLTGVPEIRSAGAQLARKTELHMPMLQQHQAAHLFD
jgi:hypothetical protein